MTDQEIDRLPSVIGKIVGVIGISVRGGGIRDNDAEISTLIICRGGKPHPERIEIVVRNASCPEGEIAALRGDLYSRRENVVIGLEAI